MKIQFFYFFFLGGGRGERRGPIKGVGWGRGEARFGVGG